MNNLANDDYWQEVTLMARLPLPPQEENDVFFLWHQLREGYGRGHREIGVPLTQAGERDYVHVKAYYNVPRLIVTIGLTSASKPEPGEQIGQMLDLHQEGFYQHFIAGLQAWYYNDVKTLMLWEVDLFPAYRVEDPTQDILLATLWSAFEQALLARFPACARIVTPGWEPNCGIEAYRRFLEARGYVPHQENTYHKMITPQKGGPNA